MTIRPATLKGTRDQLPNDMVKRRFLFETIAEVYRLFGFLEISTPSMERSETLLGKYGQEGDRLIFKVLDNGDFLKGVDTSGGSDQVARSISKRAMRYDLTVPFARFVAEHQNELGFPFKRYQIQPVWRADRPQKGRYQEFYQCDGDVIGSPSLIYEAEFIQIFDEVFQRLGLNKVRIRVNHRKVLAGLARAAGAGEQLKEIAITLDKLDKVGADRVKEEWSERGISDSAVDTLSFILDLKNATDFDAVSGLIGDDSLGREGIGELEQVFSTTSMLGLSVAQLSFDATLARGLDYYTGCIFEVDTPLVDIGSIAAGGRYDDLTSIFGLKDMTGVGVSFGADRIYDVMEELGLWPEHLQFGPKVFFVNFGQEELVECQRWAMHLRKAGVACEVYPETAKMRKQMKSANDKGVPFVALMGSEELQSGTVTLKDMKNGEQSQVSLEQLEKQMGLV